MKLFNCKVRIMAQVQDEVIKTDVTQAEIVVLKAIHGADGVLDVMGSGEADRDEATERDRLEMIYGEGIVGKIFGAPVARIGDDSPPEAKPLGVRPVAGRKTQDVPELEAV